MKKALIPLFILSALAASSCMEKYNSCPPEEPAEIPARWRIETLSAALPPVTRTAFDDLTGKFSWSEGDTLAFHLSDDTYLHAPVDPETGDVNLLIKDGVSRNNFAVYPAGIALTNHASATDFQIQLPDCYDISNDPVSDYAPLPLAAVNDPSAGKIAFAHVGGLLQLNFTAPKGIRSARVSLGRKITGVFPVHTDPDSGEMTICTEDGTEDSITFLLSDTGLEADTPVKLQVPVPTGEYNRLTIILNDGVSDQLSFSRETAFSFQRAEGKRISVKESSFVLDRDYFWFEALEAGSTVSFKQSSSLRPVLYYSMDGRKTWKLWNKAALTLEHVGDTAFFYGTSEKVCDTRSASWQQCSFQGTGNLKVGGDIMTLVDSKTGICQFYGLFMNMTCLSDASELVLPGEWDPDLANCFYNLFFGCTTLTAAPELPALSLTESCYSYMFHQCTALETAPGLPATTLAPKCYEAMFSDCTALTHVPQALPAETLQDRCYYYMFLNCKSLTDSPELPAGNLAKYCYYGMFEGCSKLAQAPRLPATIMTEGCYNMMFRYCSSLKEAPQLPSDNLAPHCYDGMFQSCTALTQAPVLNASVMQTGCYNLMFSSCKALTTAPELPSVTLASACYGSMFSNCTSLTAAPALPATVLADKCYYNMFYNCSKLTAAPVLPATVMTPHCYEYMFGGCKALKTAPELPAETLAENCYTNMFSFCTSLTAAPALPARQLAKNCYASMFGNCTKLKKIPELPAATLAEKCYYQMFSNCRGLTGTVTLTATTGAAQGYEQMFYYCTNLTGAALSLTSADYEKCCYRMFSGCTKLASISVEWTSWPTAKNAMTEWVNNVAASGSFVKPEALEETFGTDRIPQGWSSYRTERVGATL